MSLSAFSLQSKVAIVTGGGTGIGRSIAMGFAQAGVDVVVSGRRLAVLQEVVKEIKALGRRGMAVQADVTQKQDVESLAQATINEFGYIDILVNNAGIHSGTPFLELAEDEWNRVIDTNLKGCYLCSQAVSKRW